MKVKQEIKQLRKIQQLMEDNVYPGYPYMIHGIVDMEDKCGWIGLGGRKMNLEKFCHEINADLCYQLIGSTKATKGSWIVDTHMEEHEQYLKAEYDDFYIDNVEVAKLYFALYAAIRESKGTNNIIFFSYDGDSDFTCVEVFKDDASGSRLDHINSYLKEYCYIDD